MVRAVVMVVAGVIVGGAWLQNGGGAGVSVAASQPNAEAQKIENPIPGTPESVAEGRRYFRDYCRSCHGPQGKGDGSMAMAGDTPADLTDGTWDYGSTDGEIFVVIRDGTPSPDMEGYARRLKPDQMWHLVNFIKSLGKQEG